MASARTPFYPNGIRCPACGSRAHAEVTRLSQPRYTGTTCLCLPCIRFSENRQANLHRALLPRSCDKRRATDTVFIETLFGLVFVQARSAPTSTS